MRVRRVYADVSDFRAPFSSPTLTLTGLGTLGTTSPSRHQYIDISQYRQPYRQGYFQNNQLFGLGAPEDNPNAFPENLRVYATTGDEMNTIVRDASAATSQVPRLVYFGLAALTAFMGYRSYKQHKKEHGKKSPSSSAST